jgi:hypothetical protein
LIIRLEYGGSDESTHQSIKKEIDKMTSTTPTNGGLASVLDAMKEVANEGDLWKLADALQTYYPTGDDFSDIIDRAAKAGIAGKMTANTLRNYRTVAKMWPESKRIKGISFSAHREAQRLGDDVNANKRLIEQVRDSLNPGETVTVDKIRKAVVVASGRAIKSKTTRGGASQTTVASFDVLADIKSGGGQLIAQITQDKSETELEKIKRGLEKILSHTNDIRAVKARKLAAAKKAPAAKPATTNQTPPPTKATPPIKAPNGNGGQRRRGDMRGIG